MGFQGGNLTLVLTIDLKMSPSPELKHYFFCMENFDALGRKGLTGCNSFENFHYVQLSHHYHFEFAI
jgi:hypothetical protein